MLSFHKPMRQPHILTIALITLLTTGAGCTSSLKETTQENTAATLEEKVYTAFIINTHDWVNPEKSAATLNRIIDIHEQYDIPVDIYLDDHVIQLYEEQEPQLLQRLTASEQVAVSYHLRPPYPYYLDFDWLGLDALTRSELKDLLTNYETHAIDLTTGEISQDPGGYAHLADLLGYAPYVVSGLAGGRTERVMNEVYKDMGAQMTLAHGRTTEFGEKEDQLWMRPEDLEIKVYEELDHLSAEKVIEEALQALRADRPAFLNLKWHENNFYSSGTPWAGPYFKNPERRTEMLEPPFDLSRTTLGWEMKTDEQQNEQWERYEGLVSYIAEHTEDFTAINAKDLLSMLDGK